MGRVKVSERSGVMKRLLLLVVALPFLLPHPLVAWGRDGGQVVANIAQARLSPAAKKGVYELLHGATLASVSADADNYRNSHRESSRWHYVNIPLDAARYDPARDCREQNGEGDCVVAEIDRLVTVLKDRTQPEEVRAQALAFLVHFVGDLHCPLHASDNNDRGGNRTLVTFFDRPTNLHSVWDAGLIRQAGYTVTSLTEAVERSAATVSAGGTPAAWAEETRDVARDVAYRVPEDRILGQAYLDASLPALRLQLLRGGVRLAKMLNDIYAR